VSRDEEAQVSAAEETFGGSGGLRIAVAGDALDGGDQIDGDVGFGDEGAGVHFDGLALDDRGFVLGDEDDFGVGNRAANQARSVQPIHVGHGDVHEDNVGAKLFGFFDALEAVSGFADDLEIRARAEQCSDTAADKFVVVNDQDSDHLRFGWLFWSKRFYSNRCRSWRNGRQG
jgi:hypothetical protein